MKANKNRDESPHRWLKVSNTAEWDDIRHEIEVVRKDLGFLCENLSDFYNGITFDSETDDRLSRIIDALQNAHTILEEQEEETQ